MKRAGRAVELRPAPKARNAAHPQERQHSAAEGGTRDRVRPAGALRCGATPPRVRDRHPLRRRELLVMGPQLSPEAHSGRNAPRARPEGRRPSPRRGIRCGAKRFAAVRHVARPEPPWS